MHAASVYPEPGSNSQLLFDLDFCHFSFWFTQSNSLYFYCSFLYIFWGSMPLLCNDYYIIPRSFYLVKYFFNFFIKILLFRLFVWSDIIFIIHYLNYFVNFYFSFWLCSLTVPLYNTRIFYLCQIFLFLFFCILKEPYFKVFLLFYKALFYFIFLMIFLILLIFLCKHPLLFGVNLFWSYLLLHLLILLLDIYFFLLLRS